MGPIPGCLAIRGPQVLRDSWDRHKTVRQKYVVGGHTRVFLRGSRNRLWTFLVCAICLIYNICDSYDALGLVATLKPTESGGTEHRRCLEDETSPSTSTRGDPKGVAVLSTGGKIPAGHGRILRDEQGNAVDIQLAEEDDETMDTDRNVETMDGMDQGYVDEKSTTTWTQLGAHTATGTRRPNSVVQGVGRDL